MEEAQFHSQPFLVLNGELKNEQIKNNSDKYPFQS